jgi:hypothetical protein
VSKASYLRPKRLLSLLVKNDDDDDEKEEPSM